MEVYDKGDSAVLTATFRNSAGTLVDPAVVKFRATNPAGLITNWTFGVDAQVVRSSVGVFVATLPVAVVGVWAYHWTTEAGTVEDGELEVTALSTERTAAEQAARARLVRLLSPDMIPVITSADIDDLLSRARVVDVGGVLPSEDDYVPTWTTASLEAAVAAGWELRASRCVGGVDFAEDGQSFKLSQRFEQCMLMARLYQRGSSGIGSGSSRVPSIVTRDVA
jgi:hypothetical protein